ncbi:MAG: DUF86 domain-containing protein [Phycisphaerales bacterium]|nr:DUF86 domain-containing protein [Phycisphaerales bacterium]
MQRKTAKYLEDIREAAAAIREFVSGRSLADYRCDAMMRSAVERKFEIIGEAVRRIAAHDPETAARIGDQGRIISFRNVLIHGYDLIDDDEVWRVIHDHLPQLESDIGELLSGK